MVMLATGRIQLPSSPCFLATYSLKVFTWYFSASSRRRQARPTQAVMMPATQPTAVQISVKPVA
jgi:hypothetical protein